MRWPWKHCPTELEDHLMGQKRVAGYTSEVLRSRLSDVAWRVEFSNTRDDLFLAMSEQRPITIDQADNVKLRVSLLHYLAAAPDEALLADSRYFTDLSIGCSPNSGAQLAWRCGALAEWGEVCRRKAVTKAEDRLAKALSLSMVLCISVELDFGPA